MREITEVNLGHDLWVKMTRASNLFITEDSDSFLFMPLDLSNVQVCAIGGCGSHSNYKNF